MALTHFFGTVTHLFMFKTSDSLTHGPTDPSNKMNGSCNKIEQLGSELDIFDGVH